MVYPDAQNQPSGVEKLLEGTLTSSVVYPREVFKAALAHKAKSVIFVRTITPRVRRSERTGPPDHTRSGACVQLHGCDRAGPHNRGRGWKHTASRTTDWSVSTGGRQRSFRRAGDGSPETTYSRDWRLAPCRSRCPSRRAQRDGDNHVRVHPVQLLRCDPLMVYIKRLSTLWFEATFAAEPSATPRSMVVNTQDGPE